MKAILRKFLPKWIYNPLKEMYLYIFFLRNYFEFKKLIKPTDRFPLSWKNQYPCLYDRTGSTGFDLHYTYHPAWAARILARTKPVKHVDISSILHFSTLVSAFLPVEFYDYRPAAVHLSNLKTGSADLLALPFTDNSIQSLSCMHTVEHVGLGRYGDPLDPEGDIKAISELKRVLALGGDLLFVVPVGKPKLAFNAHRIYSYEQIMEYFSGLELKEFSLISEKYQDRGILYNANKETVNAEQYGCGCFWFTKKNNSGT